MAGPVLTNTGSELAPLLKTVTPPSRSLRRRRARGQDIHKARGFERRMPRGRIPITRPVKR